VEEGGAIMRKSVVETTPEDISSLGPNEIFVFGSNLAGIHGGGAARLAHQKFGAKMGIGVGLTGHCYAIPTKDLDIETMELEDIIPFVKEFLKFAKNNPDLKFWVTKIGCGLAGYEVKDIAPLFFKFKSTKNVIYPQDFLDLKH
jgi:hypothetical protein